MSASVTPFPDNVDLESLETAVDEIGEKAAELIELVLSTHHFDSRHICPDDDEFGEVIEVLDFLKAIRMAAFYGARAVNFLAYQPESGTSA